MRVSLLLPPYVPSSSVRGAASIHIAHTAAILRQECRVDVIHYNDFNRKSFMLYSRALFQLAQQEEFFSIPLLYQERVEVLHRLAFEIAVGIFPSKSIRQMLVVEAGLVESLSRILTLAMVELTESALASDVVLLFVSPAISYALLFCYFLRQAGSEAPLILLDNYTFEPATPYFTSLLDRQGFRGEDVTPFLSGDPLWPELARGLESWVDIIVVGEGYDAVRTLFGSPKAPARLDWRHLKPSSTVGQEFLQPCPPLRRRPGEVLLIRSIPVDMDGLPLPDYTLFAGYYRSAELEITRGCPYRCMFCERSGMFNGSVRSHSVEYMEGVYARLGEHDFDFYTIIDPAVNVWPERTVAVLKSAARRGKERPYQANLRCRPPDRLLLDALRDTGCKEVTIGIESGDEEVLERMNKNQNTKLLLDLTSAIGERSMALMLFLIVGFPIEQAGSFLRTLSLLEDIRQRSIIDVVEVELYNAGHVQRLNGQIHERYGVEWSPFSSVEEVLAASRVFLEPGLYGCARYTQGMNRQETNNCLLAYQRYFQFRGISHPIPPPSLGLGLD